MNKLKLLLLALLCFIATGQCFADTFTVDGLTFEGNPNSYTCGLTTFDKNITDLDVPAKVDHPREGHTYDVTYIAIWHNPGATLQTITFHEGLQEIRAFSVTFVGTSLAYPSTLVKGANNLFPNIENYYVAEGNPEYKSVDGVLYDITGKTLVAYPPAKTFGKDGSYFTDATTFQIPDGVETVWSFYGKSPIETLLVPASVTKLEERNIAKGINSLKYVDVDEGNTVYCDIDGVLCNKDATTLFAFPPKHPVEGDPATYKVPDSVTYLAQDAFNGADYIKVLDLNNVESVHKDAANESSAETIIIGPRLLDIPSGSLVPKLSYEVDPGNPAYFAMDDFLYERIYDRDNDYAQYDPAVGPAEWLKIMGCPSRKNNFTYVAPENLLVMGRGVFYGKTLTDVQFNAALEKLEGSVFSSVHCDNLDFDFTGTNVWYMGGDFGEATFHTVTFPPTLEYLGIAFGRCKMTAEDKTITIPKSVKHMPSSAYGFVGRSNVERVVFEEGCDATDYNFLYFAYQSELKEVVWNGLQPTKLGNYAFKECKNLNNFVLPASVTQLGEECFYDTPAMENFTFEEGSQLKSIGTRCFQKAGMKKMELPLSVTSIGEEAFHDCLVLEEVNIGPNANYIHQRAFQHCLNLRAINVDEACKNFSSSDGILLNKAKTELIIYPAGRNGEKFNMLPPSLTKIGFQAFYDNENIRHIVIPNKVTEIGKQAFWQCKNLESVTMLCDNAIDPAKIGHATNEWSFANDKGEDIRNQIILYVREGVFPEYVKEEGGYNDYYKEFGSSTSSGAIIKSFWSADNTEEYINVSKYAYSLLTVKSKDWTYSIPETASGKGIDGKGGEVTYEELPVMILGDYAFQDTDEYAEGTELTPKSGVREVIVHENVEYIGAKAFLNKGETTIDGTEVPEGTPKSEIYRNASTIRNIFLLSDEPGDVLATLRYKLGPDHGTKDYNEAVAGQHIYMKKSAWEKADTQADWNKYKDIISYQVPMQIDATYETLSREFDVEIDPEEVQNCKVLAYAGNAKSNDPEDPCDFYISLSKTEGTYYLRCYNIDVKGQDKNGEEVSYQGTYIPRKMGVVLKVFSEDKKTPDGYFVRIAEKQKLALDTDKCGYTLEDNILQYVTTNPMGLDIPEEGKPSTFVLQGGQLCDISETGPTEVNAVIRKTDSASDTYAMAIHKAYMSLSPSPEPPYTPAAIEEIEVDGGADQPAEYYNLAGQRVNYPTNGFYIRRVGDKAEKVFVK
mgnify:FL=1